MKPSDYRNRMMQATRCPGVEFAVVDGQHLVVRVKEICDRAGCDRSVQLAFSGKPTTRATVRGVCRCGYHMMRDVEVPNLSPPAPLSPGRYTTR